ncbi:MAG: thiamine-phosphate kinase [Campylobacterales bacterium]
MKKESYFIDKISTKSSGIGDDGVYKDGLIYSMDAFFENIHFKREWSSLKEIAQKSMLVNISDAIAMNAKPLYALLTIAMPKSITKNQIDELTSGFLEVSKKYGCEIVGGDTIANSKLDISITIISKPLGKLVERKGLKLGHELAYTGELGSVARDLKKALLGHKIPKNSKLITPKLEGEFFYAIAPYVSSGLDISDGLFFELSRLSKINRVGFEFYHPIKKSIGCSGEEYGMLFSYDIKYKKTIDRLAKKHRVKITPFARATRGRFINPCKEHHF